LHRKDCEPDGFSWVIGDDFHNSVFAWLRRAGDGSTPLLVVVNMTPVMRENYRIGVPGAAREWRRLLDTDAAVYGGTGYAEEGAIPSEEHASHGMPRSLRLTLPPLSAMVLKEAS
jgi:1,4-alpha-glucan branching enzyme